MKCDSNYSAGMEHDSTLNNPQKSISVIRESLIIILKRGNPRFTDLCVVSTVGLYLHHTLRGWFTYCIWNMTECTLDYCYNPSCFGAVNESKGQSIGKILSLGGVILFSVFIYSIKTSVYLCLSMAHTAYHTMSYYY